MKIAALIVAAGRGTRAGGDVPKQYARVGGAPVLAHTLGAFLALDIISDVQVVYHAGDDAYYQECVPRGATKLWPPVPGGATRQASVLAGLEALSGLKPDMVLIHDAARPFVSTETITRVVEALLAHPGAIAAIPLADTLKRQTQDGTIAETINRTGLWRAQTPQGFQFTAILQAHRNAAAAGRHDFTDDAALAEWAGLPVALVADSAENVKLTTAADIAAANQKLSHCATAVPDARTFETRTGTGFDVHCFCPGDHVWLGGVKIAHTHKLEGHSDADVVLHALTDALLGAIGESDIGQHFPPFDPQWKGAPSRIFLAHAAKLISDRRGRITNVDITVLAEAPKIGPHRLAIKALIASVLGVEEDRVGIKATTMEGLGFVGRREGIAAMATATVMLPIPVTP
ncbi:MAG: bifunctional 2-C-methyl-D-erythritol 4-phosphate cytidylyltransferase/2-C-methyl-D-erythritol 2,4-cyclodiphosphate synthase [Hyphomicrobium sp.]